MSLHTKPHTHGACVFSCDLPSAFLAEWPQDCLHANVATGLGGGGGGGVDPGEENSPAALAGT